MTIARSALFNAFFFVSTFLLTFPTTLAAVISPRRVIWWARLWSRLQIRAVRVICGIKVEIFGWENLPPQPVLIASRHESTLDVLLWIAVLPAACFVVKRELRRIPLFGHCIAAAGMIFVDREAGASAMRALLRGADRAVAERRHIVIFPEGTRVAQDAHPPLQPGFVAIASRKGMPIIPVMTDSGALWGRHAFRKRAGTIRVVIQPPLTIGRDRQAAIDALHAAYQPEQLAVGPAARPRDPSDLWNPTSRAPDQRGRRRARAR